MYCNFASELTFQFCYLHLPLPLLVLVAAAANVSGGECRDCHFPTLVLSQEMCDHNNVRVVQTILKQARGIAPWIQSLEPLSELLFAAGAVRGVSEMELIGYD